MNSRIFLKEDTHSNRNTRSIKNTITIEMSILNSYSFELFIKTAAT